MFELADGGTLLLDEIGDMDFKLQAKLLQVLQDQEFRRLGGKETVRVDVRVLAATHRDLELAMLENTFRQDLYYRLNVLSLRIPPLRERKEDILPMVEFLMRKHADPKKELPQLTSGLKNALLAYEWPGNIRQLENVVRKFLILRSPDMIVRELQTKTYRKATLQAAGHSPARLVEPPPDQPAVLEHVALANQQAERAAILAALSSTRWNRKQAAALLKIDYKPLLYKMKKLGIDDRSIPNQHEVSDDPNSSAPLAAGALAGV
jgi:two-component system response regulator AtoC